MPKSTSRPIIIGPPKKFGSLTWVTLTPGSRKVSPIIKVTKPKNMAKTKTKTINKRYTIKLPRGYNGETCQFAVGPADDYGFKEATLYQGLIRGVPVDLVKQSLKYTTTRTKWTAFSRRDIVPFPANALAPIVDPVFGELVHILSGPTMGYVVNHIARNILSSGATAIPHVNTPTIFQQLIRPKAPWRL